MPAHKLDKPLYHGTSKAAAIFICGGDGFKPPIYLTEDKQRAEHYAKAGTAYLEDKAKEEHQKLIADGYAIFTFKSVPDATYLVVDDYSEGEPGQWKYTKPIRGLRHFTVEFQPLAVTDEERLRLCCFAIGMWRR